MSIVSVFNQKGGSGKSMATVHIAVAAHLAGKRVIILDLDPQGSAQVWIDTRGDRPGPVGISVPDGSLERAIAAATNDGFDFVLIDSPPGVSPSTARIIAAADLVVIPVRPQPFDLAAVPATLRLVRDKRHAFVLSDCPLRAPEVRRVKADLKKLAPVLGQINHRVAFWRALVSGQSVAEFQPRGKPAGEVRAVFKAILKALK
jgi:chromosome partitioning protein